MLPFKYLLATATFAICGNAFGDEGVTITDQVRLHALLESIPVVSKKFGRTTLGERLKSLAVNVTSINIGHFEPFEISISEGRLKRGDMDYRMLTTDPSDALREKCPVIGIFNLQKRGNTWMFEDRTSNYYLHGVCKAPN